MKMTTIEFATTHEDTANYRYYMDCFKSKKPVILDTYNVESMSGNEAGGVIEVARMNAGLVKIYYRAYNHIGKPFPQLFDKYEDAVAQVLTAFVPIEDEAMEYCEKNEVF